MSLHQALREFVARDRISFHIPGHKGGRGLDAAWKQEAFALDVTEFDETDDLQCPNGILRDAQMRAAAVFGAAESWFLTNGSSLGLQAAILAACKPGDRILLDRTVHKSVIAAVVLAGAVPIFLAPHYDVAKGLYRGVTVEVVNEALAKTPEAVGAVVTSPTYYGICSDLSAIAARLHCDEKFLIVDEAHGAHFAFHRDLPQPALKQGADLVVQSAHKTLPALGQTSLLHRRHGGRISADAVSAALRLLQTTSPSYLLMSGLDGAIASMEDAGTDRLEEIMQAIAMMKKIVRRGGVLDFADTETLEQVQDATRVTVDFARSTRSGREAVEFLKRHNGIYAEMADARYLVLVVSAWNTTDEIFALQEALLAAAERGEGASPVITENRSLPMPNMVLPPRDAWMAPRQRVPRCEAEGRIAAEIVSVCPPGAAILLPGQRIDAETIAFCEEAGVAEAIEVLERE